MPCFWPFIATPALRFYRYSDNHIVIQFRELIWRGSDLFAVRSVPWAAQTPLLAQGTRQNCATLDLDWLKCWRIALMSASSLPLVAVITFSEPRGSGGWVPIAFGANLVRTCPCLGWRISLCSASCFSPRYVCGILLGTFKKYGLNLT